MSVDLGYMAGPQTISQGFATPAQPQALADRVQLLNDNGHQWMPADMQTTLAAAPTDNASLLSIADSIKQHLADTWHGFTEALDDPVLHKQPTTSLTLARFLTASLGPLPIRQDDLGTIQQNLQKQGFGKDLQATGTWGADWNAAYNQWADAQRAHQLAGDKPGSVSTGKAAHGFWSHALPHAAANAIIGFIESIPHDLRNLASDVVGGTEGAVSIVTHPQDILDPHGGQKMAQRQAAPIAAVRRGLGDQQATTQTVTQHAIGDQLGDLLTLINLVPIVGEGSNALRVARAEYATGATMAEAQRSSGVIAKSLFGGLDRRTIGMAADQNVLRTGVLGTAEGTTDAAARDALRRGPLNSRVFTNIPLLRQAGPVVGRLADADGLYYKARTLLAAPYMLPSVRVAGKEFQRAALYGLGLQAQAGLAQAVAGPSAFTQGALHARPLDTVDASIQRIAGTPFEHPFSQAVDLLGFVLHGPLGSHEAATKIGDRVQAFNDTMSDALGRIGIQGVWERGVTKGLGKSTSIDDLHQAFGSEDYFNRFVAMKTADLAAAHYAQRQAQLEGLSFGGDNAQAYRDRIGQLADEVWANPDQHHAAIRELMADPIEFENRVAADIVHESGDAKGYARNAINWMRAGDVLTDQIIRSGLAQHLYGPDGKKLIANAGDAFDFGDGVDNPVRVLNATRRDYVDNVTRLHGRVTRQVTKARTMLGRDVADAEQQHQAASDALAAVANDHPDFETLKAAQRSAQGTLQQAKARQTLLEQALQDGKIRQFTEKMKQVGGQSRQTKKEWDNLAGDVRTLRGLVKQGLAPDEQFNLADMIDRGVNPDALYTRINGEPRVPTEDIGSGDWMRQHLPHTDGAVGLGRLDNKSVQEATRDVARFRQALAGAGSDEAKVASVVEDMKNYGFREFGATEHTLGVFDSNPAKLADRLDEWAHNLASEVFVTHDAPQEVKDAIQRIRDLGYRPMLGSHIGHVWDGSLPPMPEIDGAITRRRKIAGVLGVSPEQISNRSAGRDARIRVLREMQKVADDPKTPLPPRTTAETVMQVALDRNLLDPQMRLPEKIAYTASRAAHRQGIEQLAAKNGGDLKAAAQEYEDGLLRALQVRDIPRREFVKGLTTPGEFGNGAQWGGVDEATANLLYRAALRGYAQRPGYIMGLSTLEDWARAGFTIGDKLAVHFPNNGMIQAAANLPNELFQLRNRLRFTLSPLFDFRRVAKQNVKMGLDGVTPVLNPLGHMVRSGEFDRAHALLTRLLGDPVTAGMDDADRYLYQQSVWGLYNSRHFEAYYALEKAKQGASDEEIRAGIRKVFEYGSVRKEGRSALERSMNTVFFPFSFEKTLLRNVGMHFLSHPQQALLLTGAMEGYRQANQHEEIHNWVQDHLPILKDIQKLNAFAHGISPGEFGGINAPLMNLFMPQQWGKDFSKANLKRLLPIWNDFGSLLKDTREQAGIGKNAVLNAADYAINLGAPRGALDPYRPTITAQAQRRDAEAMRNKAILAWTNVLDYNASTTDDAEKVRFPDDPRLPTLVRGEVVNRSTIGYLVQRWYPAYNPTSAATYAQQQKAKADKFVAGLKTTDPARARDYGVFVQLADQVARHLQQGDYDTATAAQTLRLFRTAAANASETDPKFLKFFNAHYRYIFGPIEAVTGP